MTQSTCPSTPSSAKSHRVLVPVTNPLGGVRTYMLHHLRPLMEAGYCFTFLAPDGEAFSEFQRDVADWNGAVCCPIQRGASMRGSVAAAIRAERYDLIHAQGLRAGVESVVGRFGSRIPLIITLHDVIVPGNDIPGRFRTIKRWLISLLARRASVIHAVSSDCRDNHLAQFPAWRRGPCRIEVIPNGTDVTGILAARDAFRASPAADPLRESLAIPADAVLGGFFGRFMPQKGFKFLIEAMAILAHSGLQDRFRLVATRDPYGYRQETLRAVADHPLVAPMVHFVEPTGNIVPLLSQVDLLVMPSLWEACPLLPMEAMLLGIPVIGSDAIGLREVLLNTPSLTPTPGDAAALAKSMRQFIEHDRAALKDAAAQFAPEAHKRFDVGASVTQLASIYASCLT